MTDDTFLSTKNCIVCLQPIHGALTQTGHVYMKGRGIDDQPLASFHAKCYPHTPAKDWHGIVGCWGKWTPEMGLEER